MGNDCRGANDSKYNIDYFLDKYGEESLLAVAKDNFKKQMMLDRIPEMSEKYKEQIKKEKNNSVNQINFKQIQIVDKIQHRVKAIQMANPGRIAKIQQKNNMCAEEILGRKQILDQFRKLRKQTIQNYEAEQNKNKETIKNTLEEHVRKLQSQKKQKFEEYENLTEQQKESLKKQIQKKFKKDLKLTKKQFEKQMSQGVVLDELHDFAHLHPKKQIQQIFVLSDQLIKKGEQIIFMKRKSQLIINTDQQPPKGCFGW